MRVLLEGLMLGFFLYWLFYYSAPPKAWMLLRKWWWRVGPKAWEGKPLSCDFCMAFWGSMGLFALDFAQWLYESLHALQGCANCQWSWFNAALNIEAMLIYLFARAVVGLLAAKALERLETVYFSNPVESAIPETPQY